MDTPTEQEVRDSAMRAAMNEVDQSQYPESVGTWPDLRQEVQRILKSGGLAGLSDGDLTDTIFGGIMSAVNIAVGAYDAGVAARAAKYVANINLQMAQAQASAAQQIAAANAATAAAQQKIAQSSALQSMIPTTASDFGVYALFAGAAWWLFGRNSKPGRR